MRYIFATALTLLAFSLPANAGWVTDLATGSVPAREHYANASSRIPVHVPARVHSAPARVYYAQNGGGGSRVSFGACAKYRDKQCGCTASHIAFGSELPGLAGVSSWLRFPRTSCQVGAAAIWPGKLVEIVTGCNNDGSAQTTGTVGF